MLQYIIKPAYTGHSSISRYDDGKFIDYDIVHDYQVDGYTQALENMGYERAYNLTYYERKLREAQENFELAKKAFKLASEHPLMGTKGE